MLRQLIPYKTIIEGQIEGNRSRGKPRRNYLEQVKEKVNVLSYQVVKLRAENREEWRLLHWLLHSVKKEYK